MRFVRSLSSFPASLTADVVNAALPFRRNRDADKAARRAEIGRIRALSILL